MRSAADRLRRFPTRSLRTSSRSSGATSGAWSRRPTVYAGYYDVFTAECFRGIGSMREMQKAKDCRGYVFTTWTPDGKYDLLPAYGEALRRIFGTDK